MTIFSRLLDNRITNAVRIFVLRDLIPRFPLALIRLLPRTLVRRVYEACTPYSNGGRVDMYRHLRREKIMQRVFRDRNIPQRPGRDLSQGKIRIGFIAPFANLLGFPQELFEKYPDNVDLFTYDVTRIYDNPASAFATFSQYRDLDLPLGPYYDSSDCTETARRINEDQLDGLIQFRCKWDAGLLLDQVTTPNILSINCGSAPQIHDKIRYQSFVQKEYPFTIRDGYVYDLNRDAYYSKDFKVSSDLFYFDKRGIEPIEPSLDVIRNKKNQIIFTGSSYKLNSGIFAEVICSVLKKDKTLRFLYYIRGTPDVQESVANQFKRHGVLGQTEHRGHYTNWKDDEGNLVDQEGWNRARHDMEESRLFMNSFPMCGASSVFEQFVLCTPVVHLNLRDEEWDPELQYVKLEMLLTETGTAKSVSKYEDLCAAVLKDDDLAFKIIEEQHRLVMNKWGNPAHFWNEIINCIRASQELCDRGFK